MKRSDPQKISSCAADHLRVGVRSHSSGRNQLVHRSYLALFHGRQYPCEFQRFQRSELVRTARLTDRLFLGNALVRDGSARSSHAVARWYAVDFDPSSRIQAYHFTRRVAVDVTRTLIATPGPFVTGRLVEIGALQWSFPISGGIKTLCKSRVAVFDGDCEEHACSHETTDDLRRTGDIALLLGLRGAKLEF